jgi:sugar phosphate isomerase/epimerase
MTTKIAISSFSFLGFGGGPDGTWVRSIPHLIDLCAGYGVDGIEMLIQHLDAGGYGAPQELAELQQYAAMRGIRIVTLAAHNNPMQVSPQARADDLRGLMRQIDQADLLGAPFVRVQGGRWGTTPDFAGFLATGGVEPPPEGHTDEEAFGWIVTSLRAAADYAGTKGITLVLENHWGSTATAEGTRAIHDAVESPWLRYVLDTGNFFKRPDEYAEMEVLLDDVALIHAKIYTGGSRNGIPPQDLARIGEMLRRIDYAGYVSIEYEGLAPADEGIRDGIRLVREHLGA